MSETPSCCHAEQSAGPRFGRLFWFAAGATLILLGLSWVIRGLEPFREAFIMYVRMMALPVVFGFVAGGLVDYYIPREYIAKFLAASRKRTVFYATGLGFLMSACSHGILALSMEIHKKGASNPAVISFLLASPWANLPITILLVSLFHWKGVMIIASALVVSISTGIAFQVLDQKGWIEKNQNTVTVPEHFSIRKDMAERMKDYRFQPARDLKGIWDGVVGLSEMLLSWVLLGILLASLSSAYVPPHFFHHYMGASLAGLCVTLIAATILEVCSEGTAPLAFEIYKQTGALGNSFVFLMGGVVTDYTEIGLVWKNLGRRCALWMIALTIPQVVLIGWIFNRVL